MAARNTKCTPELRGKIAAFVQGGASIPRACEAAGISWNTVKDWAKPPLSLREPYKSFNAAVEAAKAKWAAGAEMTITSLGKKDWKAIAWMLERRHPEEYAPISRLEVTGKGGQAIEVTSAKTALGSKLDELRKRIDPEPGGEASE